mmetsp:Transcript_13358/g.22256  ORF Transcript_13358/g.22256 Transcript_13358/m.22256 type:complete len:294 (-) Transcript_13358:1933-2814(-)
MNMLLVLSLALVTTVAVGYYVPVAIVPIVRKTASSIYQTSIHMSSSVESSDDASNVNVKLDNVKNMRDLSTAAPGIAPARIIRTGCVSRATSDDITEMKEKFNFKAFLDLRSPAEIEEDEHINSQVYSGFHDYQFDSRQKSFVTIKTSSSSGSGSGSGSGNVTSDDNKLQQQFCVRPSTSTSFSCVDGYVNSNGNNNNTNSSSQPGTFRNAMDSSSSSSSSNHASYRAHNEDSVIHHSPSQHQDRNQASMGRMVDGSSSTGEDGMYITQELPLTQTNDPEDNDSSPIDANQQH